MALRPSYSYNIAIGTASTPGGRVTPVGIHQVRIATTADAYVAFGVTPVATVGGSMLVRASTVGECFEIAAGESVAVISGTAGGVVNVSEMTS